MHDDDYVPDPDSAYEDRYALDDNDAAPYEDDFDHDYADEDDAEDADYDYPDGDHDETNYDPYAGQDVYEIEPCEGWD